ncbi:prepilin-type N-terminal cleavage/methylation domain-containing protein [Bacillus sp. FJAT-49705]|uniref:Prepilin-type N-terminal cleavage/methylation domain-containing protein n=1 Tax=Cytobacillus citreus TaxID=2833586 RepID=A0ABS5NUG7_9BACI|nr:prepilin-type N-terminal cleavage/methylation domain-containing protein [Cytobacillus citreus]MBS4191477.1 prepilin-type N-terminal cleavage/methylation domain-containing protein [Cytobacillus citreus]
MKLITFNQKGITLLEVLLSILILSIILVTIMKFFPQMGLMNQKNVDKTEAINIAKEELIAWQKNKEINSLLKLNSVELPSNITEDADYYYSEKRKKKFNIHIKINKKSDLITGPIKANQIHIQLLNDNNSVVTEIYGYIIVE